jgi:AAA domain-containing protein/CHC2-type zinc finger protein/Toprim domain-containing protein
MKQKIYNHFNRNYLPFFEKYVSNISKLKETEYRALCCFHDENNPSFNFNIRNGRYFCHGCQAKGDIFSFFAKHNGLNIKSDFQKILKGIASDFGIQNGKKETNIVAEYIYSGPGGKPKHKVARTDNKDFYQSHYINDQWVKGIKGIETVPYNLPEVIKADEVMIVEGEKDVNSLKNIGFVATTNAMGAGKWKDSYNKYLEGKNIVLIPDNDSEGKKHMQNIAQSLDGQAKGLKWLELPDLSEKGDVSDFINKYDDKDEAGENLAMLVENAEPWEPEKEPQNKKTSFTAAELMQIDFPEPKWAIPDILPEGLNFLAGKPKQGKSVMALNICLAIATGGKALGKDVIKGSVLYLALEDTGRRLQYRIGQMLHDTLAPDGLHIFTHWPRMGEGGISQIESEVEKHDNLRLLVIDTLAKFKPINAEKNKTRYDIDYQTVSRIKDIADKYLVPILLISHQRKSEADDIFDTISGTLGLTGAADGILVLARKTGQDMAELHLVGRDIDAAEYALSYDPSIWTWTLLGDAQEVKNTRDQQTLYDALKKHTDQDNLMTPKELSEITDLKASYIKATLPRLIQQGNVYKRGRGNYFYRLETYQDGI